MTARPVTPAPPAAPVDPRPTAGRLGWRPWLAIPLLAVLVYVGARPVGPAPPLGPLIDPAHGIWSMEREALARPEQQAALAGLDSTVTIQYDVRGVPHITATTELDAYRALGYIVARDR